MQRKALSDKVLVLGIDGMDPRLTRKLVDEGKMPATKKLLEKGSAREDLTMLGGHPTVTPPMWTTLATGAYPVTHGITCFWRQSKDNLDALSYNLDSRLCKAEQIWNVFVEAGKKTLVWHWPGSSWPPTSDSENLHVVDGTNPSMVNTSVSSVDHEYILGANVKTPELLFRSKAASDSHVPCVIEDLEPERDYVNLGAMAFSTGDSVNIILSPMDGEASLTDSPYDVVMSPIKEAHGWKEAPENAREFYLLYSKGLIRRPALILQNENGEYDRVVIYKNKKEMEKVVELRENVFTKYIIDDAIKNDQHIKASRCMRLLHLDKSGDNLTMWVSSGLELDNDTLWSPKSLYREVVDNVGYPIPGCMLGGADERLIRDCMGGIWEAAIEWQSGAINYLIQHEKYDAVFSHFHIVDNIGHMIVKYLKKGHKQMTPEKYEELFEEAYMQTDRYVSKFLHLIDEGWTIFLVSDHAQVCPEHDVPMLSETAGVNVRVMEELGFTHVKKDENGNDLKEIDWENTKAIASRANHIYINLKGRWPHGIVDPADKYQVEEEIMTALYGYHDKKTGQRVIALALRNKDAVLLGLGGPESGDIIYFLAEGYNLDHADSLSTTYGVAGTSVSPIFIAAGPGIKEGYYTDRIIREVDLAPTVAVVGGVRMPKQCEGAPVYQILTEEY